METVEQLVSFHRIQVQLSGGAPWGFTLKGGTEHGEPLVITKIEEGGKAARCEKLRVGDELININGSALYGSRQEALILIKGSYRILKLAVRRRSIPHIRPPSWLPIEVPPPPPPPLPCLPLPADSPPLPPPPAPPAMQPHPCACTLTWNTSDNSDLPMQWGQLCRPYSSTDRSSSLGSMESLDTATPIPQPYSDSRNSPVDQTLFNSKRDSAYSSFSASSNMSDYGAVPLRPVDVCSADGFPQSLAPTRPSSAAAADGRLSDEARAEARRVGFKFSSLNRPRQKLKERPSSWRGGDFDLIRNGECRIAAHGSPAHSPNSDHSLENNPGCPNLPKQRCASAPTDIAYEETAPSPTNEPGTANGFQQVEESSHLECIYSQSECELSDKLDATVRQLPAASDGPASFPLHASVELQEESQINHSASTGLQWQKDPDETQLGCSQLTSNNSSPEAYSHPCSRWSSASPDAAESQERCREPPKKWGQSCCSTPESVLSEEGRGAIQHLHPWGRSVSAPEDTAEPSTQGGVDPADQMLGGDFQPLSAAASVDTLLEEQRADERRGEVNLNVSDATAKKPNSSRNHRRNRRRSERFATNLRNEIQRKKAQLQRSAGPGGLISCGETVQEEDGADLHEESEDPDAEVNNSQTKVIFGAQDEKSINSVKQNCDDSVSTTTSVQIMDTGVPNFRVGVRVVEEPAPAGKARRWRWTPEHKLQPEPSRLYGVVGESVSRHGVCAFTSAPTCAHSASCSRMEESDILPFADRRKFFEETSKASGLRKYQEGSERGPFTNQRRHSYQGEKPRHSNADQDKRPSVCDRQKKMERAQSKEREESARDRKRDDTSREVEMQWEKERQEREVERERLREKERQERVRLWERQMELQLEKEGEEEMRRQRKEFCRKRDGNRQDHHLSNGGQVQPTLYQGRRDMPTQYPAQQHETSKLNRKYSLTERDCTGWRRESQPADGIGLHHQPSWIPGRASGNRNDCNGHPAAPLSQWSRTMSENDLHTGQRRSRSVGPMLREVEEGADVAEDPLSQKKKKNPPPRPPPPKWEQFHRRRSSHHTLFASSSTAPPQHPCTEPPSEEQRFSSAEPSRQRSYSLPPQRQEAAAEGCPRCSCHQPRTPDAAFAHIPPDRPHFAELSFSIAPPSPMFSRRSFRPVMPTYLDHQHESETAAPPAPQNSDEMWNSHKPPSGPGAEWERILSSGIQSDYTLPLAVANGHLSGVLLPESFSVLNHKQQQQHQQQMYVQSVEPPKVQETGTESETTLSPSPTHSLEAELDVPFETDIDDFQEDEGLPAEEEPLTSELPCFALPATVLETDIDTLTEPRADPVGSVRTECSSAEEEPESGRERLSLEEHSGEGESGTESWKGAFHNTDSLDRQSGASSSCSSYYSTSAAKAQLLSQMKDLTDREREEDDELTYKRQLMESLRKKLGVLREAQRGLQDDVRANAQLGEEVEGMVVGVCKPNEVDKFRMFIGDLDKVVSLLLSLSGRLLRVETALDMLNPETEDDERFSLLEKKRQLMRQLSEAQDLKDHVDRREQAVSRVLARCLSPEQHRDYSHFVKMKAALLVEQKQLEDKIRLGEEQLRGLRESLGLGLGLGLGMSVGYGHY
ncbi:protein Shroom4 [Syngnathus scovelli]|uniref:protein Shroom4 n=1 Tax=Syngnathus scovelli TaxID=161590 RepID=UPI002110C893|nr:protein Shroom4 [Syngnathus scovelli]